MILPRNARATSVASFQRTYPLHLRGPPTKLTGVTTRKITIDIFFTLRTSNLTRAIIISSVLYRAQSYNRQHKNSMLIPIYFYSTCLINNQYSDWLRVGTKVNCPLGAGILTLQRRPDDYNVVCTSRTSHACYIARLSHPF
jgi:hypothetical protein